MQWIPGKISRFPGCVRFVVDHNILASGYMTTTYSGIPSGITVALAGSATAAEIRCAQVSRFVQTR